MSQLTPFTTIRRKVICDYLDKFPNTSNRSLANIIYRDNPLMFTNSEQVRSIIRFYKGSWGVKARKILRFTKYYQHDPMA